MNFTPYIREIGRGAEGSRDLARDDAAQLYAAILDGGVPDLELGAIILGLRVKGESVDEMAGFLEAANARVNALLKLCRLQVVAQPYQDVPQIGKVRQLESGPVRKGARHRCRPREKGAAVICQRKQNLAFVPRFTAAVNPARTLHPR